MAHPFAPLLSSSQAVISVIRLPSPSGGTPTRGSVAAIIFPMTLAGSAIPYLNRLSLCSPRLPERPPPEADEAEQRDAQERDRRRLGCRDQQE
jgi:hypothetical protein